MRAVLIEDITNSDHDDIKKPLGPEFVKEKLK
jgi:hypothetical protein